MELEEAKKILIKHIDKKIKEGKKINENCWRNIVPIEELVELKEMLEDLL